MFGSIEDLSMLFESHTYSQQSVMNSQCEGAAKCALVIFSMSLKYHCTKYLNVQTRANVVSRNQTWNMLICTF